MQRLASILILAVATLMISGCGTSGAFNSATVTEVQLSEGNYEMVATSVSGESSAEYIVGVSANVYRQMQTFGLYRLSGTGMLYGEALEDLWDNFRDEYGSVEGRNLALVNVRYDTDAVNLLVYTKATVVVRADVVEFTE